MSTSLKIAAAALLALFASSFAASPAQAQHRNTRLSGIIRDVVDVIADEIEDYEDDYADEYEYEEEDFEEEFTEEDDFLYSEYQERRITSTRIPSWLVGKWSVVIGPDVPGAGFTGYLFTSSGSATRYSRHVYPGARAGQQSLGKVVWSQGTLIMEGRRYMVSFRGSKLLLTDIRGNVTKLTRVE